MSLDSQAQAVLLLTVPFGKSDPSGARVLSTREWARFAVWLKDHNLEPSALLTGELECRLSGWTDRSITLSRLKSLINRGTALGLALERWQRAGLWFMTRSDPDYPGRLKRLLRVESPPVLFGCGNRMLLERGGVAVVGSRNAAPDDLAYTEALGDAAARQGYSIVSGGARGVDQSAMLGALRSEGTAIGVLADSLMRAATSAKYRSHLVSGDLVLISPFNPEAGFNVGNAMSRNRYIYCLADAAVVVSSTPDKGGTWKGAIEGLTEAWVPLWVKRTKNSRSGNPRLVQRGARWMPDELTSLAFLLDSSYAETDSVADSVLPLPGTEAANPAELERGPDPSDGPDPDSGTEEHPAKAPSVLGSVADAPQDQVGLDFHTLFLVRLLDITSDDPMRAEDIASRLKLERSQVNTWLKRGVNDGKIKKLTKPVRYQSTEAPRQQASLFGNGR